MKKCIACDIEYEEIVVYCPNCGKLVSSFSEGQGKQSIQRDNKIYIQNRPMYQQNNQQFYRNQSNMGQQFYGNQSNTGQQYCGRKIRNSKSVNNYSLKIRNKMAIIAAILCFLPFANFNLYEINYGYGSKAYITLKTLADKISKWDYFSNSSSLRLKIWCASNMKIVLIALGIVLLVSAFVKVKKLREVLIVANIICIVSVFFLLSEMEKYGKFGMAFYLIVAAIIMSVRCLGKDEI